MYKPLSDEELEHYRQHQADAIEGGDEDTPHDLIRVREVFEP